MKNPFNPQNLGEAHLKRNVFDLGRNSIFTNDFFKLYPFFCQEIIPGDTVRIDAQIGVRGMPTVFPVQTKCRASMEFYYVRNRTLMDNFEDYIFMTKDIEAPWLRMNNERAKKMVSIGSLGDAFNVPTSLAVGTSVPYNTNSEDRFDNLFGETLSLSLFVRAYKNVINSPLPVITPGSATGILYPLNNTGLNDLDFTQLNLASAFPSSERINVNFCFLGLSSVDNQYIVKCVCSFSGDYIGNTGDWKVQNLRPLARSEFETFQNTVFDHVLVFTFLNGSYSSVVSNKLYYTFSTSNILDATDDNVIDSNPFVGDNPDIRLNVLPYRAYEMCCNYYYRNEKNNPYVLNGESQYNEFIPTHASGPDDNLYDYHYRNWELDRFTSAIQSPQFGEAPLVGLTYSPTSPTADLTFQGSLDGGETKDYTVKVGVNSDGDIDSIVDFDSDVPSANLQRLQRQIQAGISINDLRITNSFQRFLENTIRRGLRYRNQLKSHFGVSVDYPDIDVPQYIGGASGFLDSGQVTNMADSPNAGLGDYVGTLQGGISMRNKITHYCPEHGFIIGIFSIAPIPNYPQSISKVMIKTNPLDYYLPEFGKIGYVPIHYSELMPLQTPSDGSVDDVFGYQKAHYDYMQAFDEVHGDFRTNLRDFVVSRTFKERPLLSADFTVGSPDQLNDIWVANNIADAYGSSSKFMCSSHVSCIMKREIAMIGTPSLE